MDIKYIEDRQGNKVLPITSVNAVRDAGNNTLDTILSNYKSEVNGRLDDQDEIIETLNGNDVIPVDTVPAATDAEANKIYRKAGTDNYEDWMLDTQAVPLAMKKIATYSFPGIDEKPTAGSSNLSKSSGIYDAISNETQYQTGEKYSSARILTGYKLVANNSTLWTDDANSTVVIFELGQNKEFYASGINSQDACQVALCSGVGAGSNAPYTFLKGGTGQYGFFGKTTTEQQYVAITVNPNSSYSVSSVVHIKEVMTAESERSKNIDDKILKTISKDVPTPARLLTGYEITDTSYNYLLKTSETTNVLVFEIGANKPFYVKGQCSNGSPYIALTAGTNASAFNTFQKIKVDSNYDYFGKTTQNMQYIAITIDKNTDYNCYLCIDGEDIRTVINVLRSDSDIDVLKKMIRAINLGNCDVYFEKGTYTLQDVYLYMRDTLGWSWTMELPIGNNCRYFFNGSTIISEQPTETYETSRNILGCKAGYIGVMPNTDFELHDGVLINNGGTYCVHDEGAYSEQGLSHVHRYYNMKMVLNTGVRTEGLSKCIGGGAGYNGFIVISNCIFLNNNTVNQNAEDVSWHGKDGENVDPVDLKFYVNNNYFSRNMRVASSFRAHDSILIEYCGNSHASAPSIDSTPSSVEKYLFNNETR